LRLRPQVTIAQGRMFRPGSTEIVVGSAVLRQFDGVGLGQTLRFAQRQWVVVGVLEAGQSAYASEIWGDGEQLLQAFRRTSFSSVVAQLQRPDEIAQVEARIAADPRLTVEVRPERQFYEDQGRDLSRFITIIGNTLSVIFSLGAIIGAAITMYASVATRTAEIGTLRALGFGRGAILTAFLLEALLLSLVGAAAGLLAASFLQVTTISTTNFNSFSELAFSFRMTPGIVLAGAVFALVMGLVGGVLPAIKASRMKIVDALRAA
jgi:ABC-type antimicrobial peptide transport system permease subunit